MKYSKPLTFAIMGNAFYFKFYPGEYLRDTQCLEPVVQVAYDRIMCEHIRKICISKSQLNFFTKKLSAEEISDLMMMLTEVGGGFQIAWVAESMRKSLAYSESRSVNRTKKPKKDMNTYHTDMESNSSSKSNNKDSSKNEDLNADSSLKDSARPSKKMSDVIWPFDSRAFKDVWQLWTEYRKEKNKPAYKPIGLQGVLSELAKLSGGNEPTAIKIIYQSIHKNWEGFFQLKNENQNGHNRHGFTKEGFDAAIAANFGKKN